MKVNIVRDEKGNVVATYENPSTHNGPKVSPKLKSGYTTLEVEAADNYKSILDDFYKQHSIVK